MRSAALSIVALLTLSLASLTFSIRPPQDTTLQSLIALLNAGDKSKLQEFVAAHFADSAQAESRSMRLMDMASQHGPFKFVKPLPSQKGHLKALIQDKDGVTLELDAELNADKPPRIGRIMVTPFEDGPTPKDYAGWSSLQSLADEIRKDTDNPALGIAVIRAGKLEVVVSGFRTVGGTPVGKDEPWSIGSIGKPICASVIGKLIEQGKLKWSTTLGEIIPDLISNKDYRPITLDQLMHHRGGVPEDPGMRKPQVDKIVAGQTDPTKIRINYAKDILSRPLTSKPGTAFAYSNAGYALLGVVAERVTSKSYESLVKDLVFGPLGLKHSYTAVDILPKARPSGHLRGPGGLEEANFSGPMEYMFAPAGGGLFMSLEDLARFGQAHLVGLSGKDGFLKSTTIQRLHRGEVEVPGESRLYACGWGIEKFGGLESMHTHNGSNGTMRAQVGIFPKAGLVICSFVNAGGEREPSPPLQAILAVARKFMRGS